MISDVHTRNSVPNVGLLRTRAHDIGDPTVGSQLGSGEQHHDQQQQDENRLSEALHISREEHRRDERNAQLRGDAKGRHTGDQEDLVEPGDQEKGDHEAASRAKFTQHVEVGHFGRDALLHREFLLEENETIGDRGQEHQARLPLPQAAGHTGGIDVAHRDREEPAEHQAAGPSRVQNIEVPRFFAGEERRCHGIHYCFDRAVTERKNEGPDIEQRKAGLLPGQNRLRTCARTGQQEGRRQSNDRRKHMQA